MEMKQSVEQTKREIHDLKVNKPLIEHPTPTINTLYCRVPPPMLYAAELIATEVSTLEEEHKALLSENDGEMEFTQSLKSQLEKLRVHIFAFSVMPFARTCTVDCPWYKMLCGKTPALTLSLKKILGEHGGTQGRKQGGGTGDRPLNHEKLEFL
ncbi:hypothetical protein RND81_03G111500 [Saponaria officinalis]|uniref:Uncharacterized protein n=1 Tax=Saponaria officinalis TaxID=3572 RepID=A0AAW1M670_SAPOF